jgi:hypothetical protein
MHHMAIIRSMSTREADHTRGRYYMQTGYVPNPNIEYPSRLSHAPENTAFCDLSEKETYPLAKSE